MHGGHRQPRDVNVNTVHAETAVLARRVEISPDRGLTTGEECGGRTFLGGAIRHSSQSLSTRFMCLSNAMKRPTMARPSSSVTLMR